MQQNADSKKEYGLLGEKLSHSFSPMIHNKLGNGNYGLFAVEKTGLDAFMKERGFSAINVTIPYKQAVMPYLARISDTAREIGSVNTIVKEADGSLSGYNTDFSGMLYAMHAAGISCSGKKVLILGSGGTSLTARAAARRSGAAEIVVISRKGENNYENISSHADAEVIINTTPVGMYPNNGAALISLKNFPRCGGVFDVIYNPFLTPLLKEAKALGIPYQNGLPMLVAQAKYAHDLFFGRVTEEYVPETGSGKECGISERSETASESAVIDAITASLYAELSNIVLIGMPSAGKTSVGKALSELLNRPLVDLDTALEETYGQKIPDIFAKEGEAGFRDKESVIAARYGKERGQIIACGGGVVLREENAEVLKQNGFLVFLERDLRCLSTDGRPLSKDYETLCAMYEKRLPLYRKYANCTVPNDDSTAHAAERIRDAFAAWTGQK
ncbi:MAG: shikimate kinase [Eubacteriales bacterium]|nr:shikimate kinase [Eubacteriales bacterium]